LIKSAENFENSIKTYLDRNEGIMKKDYLRNLANVFEGVFHGEQHKHL